MRIRASVAVVIGALALTALAVPAAQADGGYGDTKVTKVVVDGDNKAALSTSGLKTITVSVTATDDSGILSADPFALQGPDYGYWTTSKPVCKASSHTTSTCTASVKIDPKVDFLSNAMAGTWYVDAWVDARDGDYIWKEKAGSFKLQRASKLTVNAAPEPVKKGKTVTVTGALTRASWDAGKYTGYAAQPVKLQFLKKGAKTYTTLKTVKTDAKGNLKTTVKASVDGYYRYSFAGTPTTPAVNATADFVDVR
ncbi:calcium-binding protein [Streptomyces sp. NPDC004690]